LTVSNLHPVYRLWERSLKNGIKSLLTLINANQGLYLMKMSYFPEATAAVT
jgi:hypothetical protein